VIEEVVVAELREMAETAVSIPIEHVIGVQVIPCDTVYPTDLMSYSMSSDAETDTGDKYTDQVRSEIKVEILHQPEIDNVFYKETQKLEVEMTTSVEEISHEPPQFKDPIKPQIRRVGESCTFTACVIGEPRPLVKWLRNKQPIDTSDVVNRIQLEYDSETVNYCLTIIDCQLDDTGTYSCQANNEAGKATCTANLVVVRK
jgi:hypothetical protein